MHGAEVRTSNPLSKWALPNSTPQSNQHQSKNEALHNTSVVKQCCDKDAVRVHCIHYCWLVGSLLSILKSDRCTL